MLQLQNYLNRFGVSELERGDQWFCGSCVAPFCVGNSWCFITGFCIQLFLRNVKHNQREKAFWSLLCLYFKDYDSMMRWFGKGFKNSTQTNSTHSLSKQLLFHFEAIVY